MAQMCPKCSADTETLEEESKQFCIHEKMMMAAGIVALVAVAMYVGIV